MTVTRGSCGPTSKHTFLQPNLEPGYQLTNSVQMIVRLVFYTGHSTQDRLFVCSYTRL